MEDGQIPDDDDDGGGWDERKRGTKSIDNVLFVFVWVWVCVLKQFDYLKCENDLKLEINEFVTFLNCLQFFIRYMFADG